MALTDTACKNAKCLAEKPRTRFYINACCGDLAALSAALNIMARRARMLGLDAPVRTENRTDVTMQNEGVLVVGRS
ncbi:hypothetical protein D3C86_546480 [compost metagenome]